MRPGWVFNDFRVGLTLAAGLIKQRRSYVLKGFSSFN
jgi:hypothetical protein